MQAVIFITNYPEIKAKKILEITVKKYSKNIAENKKAKTRASKL